MRITKFLSIFIFLLIASISVYGIKKEAEDLKSVLKGVQIDTPDKVNDTIKMLYFDKGFSFHKIPIILHEAGVDINNITDEVGRTALHKSVKLKDSRSLDLLVDFGADVAKVDNNGLTALHLAAIGGWVTGIHFLLRTKENRLKVLDKVNKYARTALHLAAITRNSKCLEVLLDYGAYAEITDIFDNTALDYAIYGTKCKKCIEILVNFYLIRNLDIPDDILEQLIGMDFVIDFM